MVAMAHTVGVVVVGASLAAFVAQPTLRGSLLTTLARWTGYHAPGGLWRIAAILLALVNLKNLPFVWHVGIPLGDMRRDPQTDQVPSYASFAPYSTSFTCSPRLFLPTHYFSLS
jgi:hypothetical protein